MTQNESRRTELADAVAAGTPIDWDSIDLMLTEEQDRRVLVQFKVLALVADVYRLQRAEPTTIH
jgi:hypothetical protein